MTSNTVTAPKNGTQPPIIDRPIIGACLYCGNADPAAAYVHCYEHPVVVRLWCADIAACDRRQEQEAAAMSRGEPACCESSEGRRVRLEVGQCWASLEAERFGGEAA